VGQEEGKAESLGLQRVKGEKLEEGGSEQEFVFGNTTPDVDLICRLENRRRTGRGAVVSPSINVRKRTHRTRKKNIKDDRGIQRLA
jgi:hypothetical protein